MLRCWFLILIFSGCGSAGATLTINSSKAAREAIKLLDSNSDGKLEAGEIQNSCPGLFAAFAIYDTNRDNFVDEEELRTRFQGLVDTQVGVVSFDLVITLNGSPLADAKVTMTPMPFLKDYLKPAEGTTDRGGMASMGISPTDPTVQYGLYSVTVSKMTGSKEQLSDKYNTKTTLGCEVGKENRGQPVTLILKSP
jgi:hypothetical protein